MCLSAATYGDAPSSTESQGNSATSRKTEPTKKTPMRATTDRVAFWTASSRSRLSAAATVTISAPTMEKITTTMAAKTAPTPRKIAIVATLIPANQNSNSPKDDTENKLVTVINTIRHSDSSQSGAWN